MAVVNGQMNSWQTGDVNGAPHAIEVCGSFTGHAARVVALCDESDTAQLLVQALYILKSAYDADIDHRKDEIKSLLERAGLV